MRIAREIPGASDGIIPYLLNEQRPYNTLIISPPQCGKTTILRDIVRQLSNGIPGKFKGVKVGVVDERSEIAGTYEGVPQKNVGIRTDVLDACPKAEGMIMLIRSMSPQVIVADEIGKIEDVYAIGEAVQAGVNLIVSVHGADIEQIKRRPSMNQLLHERIFERYVVLGCSRGVGTVEGIYDEQFLALTFKSSLDRREEQSCG
jgi:stage III sporulation protein AA